MALKKERGREEERESRRGKGREGEGGEREEGTTGKAVAKATGFLLLEELKGGRGKSPSPALVAQMFLG